MKRESQPKSSGCHLPDFFSQALIGAGIFDAHAQTFSRLLNKLKVKRTQEQPLPGR